MIKGGKEEKSTPPSFDMARSKMIECLPFSMGHNVRVPDGSLHHARHPMLQKLARKERIRKRSGAGRSEGKGGRSGPRIDIRF